MPKLKIQDKEYSLRTPPNKDQMSLMGGDRAGMLERRYLDCHMAWNKALLEGVVGETENELKKAWLDFCGSVFSGDVADLEYENLKDSEVFEIRDFFGLAWEQATHELRKRMTSSEASAVKTGSDQKDSQKVSS